MESAGERAMEARCDAETGGGGVIVAVLAEWATQVVAATTMSEATRRGVNFADINDAMDCGRRPDNAYASPAAPSWFCQRAVDSIRDGKGKSARQGFPTLHSATIQLLLSAPASSMGIFRITKISSFGSTVVGCFHLTAKRLIVRVRR